MSPRMKRSWLRSTTLLLLSTSLLSWGCGARSTSPLAPSEPSTALAKAPLSPGLLAAIRAQEEASPQLLASPGVVGTGATIDAQGRPRVLVLVESDEIADLPAAYRGVAVERLVVGEIRPWALTGTYRPVPIGVSAGNANECLPGTIGCVLKRGPRRYLLSANHVFARQNQAAIGEPIVQPSLPDLDPSCGADPTSAVVAELSDFEPVVYDGKTPNAMDAAIAEFALPSPRFDSATLPEFYGTPSSVTAPATVKLPVMKVGRTTELTRGILKGVNVKVKVTFPSGTALFTGQVVTSQGFGAFGDSGALVVTDDGANRPVGMVIGGGSNGSAIVTPIDVILSRFGAAIDTR